MMMDMIAILVMANARLCLIISVLVLPSDKISFYLLLLCENVNVVSTNNENFFSSMNATNKQKRVHDVSLKLWHYRLGHISRGRIDGLVKNNILPPLELSECIKEKYVKKIKKDAK